MFKKVLLSCIFLCSACVSYKNVQDKIISSLDVKDYNSAEKIVEENYNKKNSILLFNLENGLISYLKKDYNNSLKYFDAAEKIADDLYTVSITTKLKSFLNDNLDDYYGRNYELGLIRFYKSLIYYNLYVEEGDISYLRKSRSNIINWASLNNSFVDSYYNDDLLQKIWGAFIYKENEDSRNFSNINIAKNKTLYKYCVFPTFNSNNLKYRESLLKNQIDKSLINKTQNYELVEDYLNTNHNEDNFFILVKRNFINKIETKKVQIPLALALFANPDSEFLQFMTLLMVFNASNEPAVYIELPYVKEPKIENNLIVEIYKHNKKIKEFPLIVVEPLNDLLYDDFENEKTEMYSKIITAVSAKYVAAITSAYALYQNTGSFISALAYYNGAKIVIDKTSIPDVRLWGLLPKNIYLNSLKLDKGKYVLKIKDNNRILYKQNIDIKDKNFIDINI